MLKVVKGDCFIEVVGSNNLVELHPKSFKALLKAKSCGCECYITEKNKRPCAKLSTKKGTMKVFEIHETKTKGIFIYYNSHYLDKGLIKIYRDIVQVEHTKQSGTDLRFSLSDMPYEVFNSFLANVISNIKVNLN